MTSNEMYIIYKWKKFMSKHSKLFEYVRTPRVVVVLYLKREVGGLEESVGKHQWDRRVGEGTVDD